MFYLKYLGAPYVPGARGPRAFDCLGLFLAVQRDGWGRDLIDPHVDPLSRGHVAAFGELRKLSAPVVEVVAGDALLFRISPNLLHVATALDGRAMIHAAPETGVAIEDINSPAWAGRAIGAFRFA